MVQAPLENPKMVLINAKATHITHYISRWEEEMTLKNRISAGKTTSFDIRSFHVN